MSAVVRSWLRCRPASFDDLARHPAAHYIPASRVPGREINADGLRITDMPDDLVVLHDAVNVPGAGVVWQGLLVNESIHYMPPNWHTVSWLQGHWDEATGTVGFDEAQVSPARVVDEPVLMLDTVQGSDNFGHFVHDTLPYALLLQRAQAVFPDIRFHVGHRPKFPNQFRLFAAAFGHPIEASVDVGNARLRQLVVARRQSMIDRGPVWSMSFAGLNHARAAALRAWGLQGLGGTMKVFLHRFEESGDRIGRGPVQGRNYSNTDALLVGLLRAGFVALEPGRTGIEDIADLLSRAETVVSLHGAGLANLLFCPAGARVFELRSHAGNWRSLEAASMVLGQRFAAVVQPAPPPGTAPLLDVDAIVKAVA